MNMVKNVGSKLDQKLKSGEIKESELMKEANDLMEKMKNISDVDVSKRDNIDDMFGTIEDSSEACSKNNITIKNNLEAIKNTDIGVCDDGYDAGF